MVRIRSIPQIHRGITFRSRTEARWAEFFHLTETPFVYENEGYQLGPYWYVPDFWLPDGEAFLEVKGIAPSTTEQMKAHLLARQSERPVVIACGNPRQEVVAYCYQADGDNRRCFLVEEHKSLTGVWLAEFASGGGWSRPLKSRMKNCAAYGYQHPALDEAGMLQFRAPQNADSNPFDGHDSRRLGAWESVGIPALSLVHEAYRKMNEGDNE